MKRVTLQQNTLTLFFWAFLTYFFNVLSHFLTIAKDLVMVNQGMQLAIDFSYDSAGLATALFLGQFVFDYLYIAFSWIVSFFAAILIVRWIIAMIQERKVSILLLGIIVSLSATFFVHISPLFFICFLGVIILYYPTVFDAKSLFGYSNFNEWFNDFSSLFRLNTNDSASIKVVDYIQKKPCTAYHGKMMTSVALNVLVYIGSIASLGLLSGILLYFRDQYEFNHSSISGYSLRFSSKWSTWFLKGIKWSMLTWLTLGLYWLTGACRLDYYQLRSTSVHFENDHGESFFDGVLGQYIFYRLLALILSLFTFGLAYPVTSRYLSVYLTQHTIVSGHRLMCQYSIKNDFSNFKITYPLFILTFGLSSVIYHYVYLCYFRESVHIDINPRLYGEDEAFVVNNEFNETLLSNNVPIKEAANKSIETVMDNNVDGHITQANLQSAKPMNVKSDEKVDVSKKENTSKKSSTKKSATKSVKTVDREGKRILKRVVRKDNSNVANNLVSKQSSGAKEERKVTEKKTPIHQELNKASVSKRDIKRMNHKATSTQTKPVAKQQQKNTSASNTSKATHNTQYQMPVASRKIAKQLKKKR